MSKSEDNVNDNASAADEKVLDDVLNQLESADDETSDSEENAEVSIESLQKQLDEAQAKVNENWEKALRIQAELDNVRKRSEKQVADAHKYAIQRFVEELLPVADSLEMGYAVEGEVEQIREGIGLTMNVFKKAMEKFDVVAINPLGDKFNPDLHQAMAMQPSDEYENDHVSAVMQKGYTLNGRVVRPAMVMVVKN